MTSSQNSKKDVKSDPTPKGDGDGITRRKRRRDGGTEKIKNGGQNADIYEGYGVGPANEL